MPRAVQKPRKRQHDTAKLEDKIQNCEMAMNDYAFQMEKNAQETCDKIDKVVRKITLRTNASLLQMKMSDFMDLNLKKFDEHTISHTKIQNKLKFPSTPLTSRSSNIRLPQPLQNENHIDGPLCSAIKRLEIRSQSASNIRNHDPMLRKMHNVPDENSTNTKNAKVVRPTRPKLREPRIRACSADRKAHALSNLQMPALMRWPKDNEILHSASGTPIMTTQLTKKVANINIPTKTGAMSIQPVKMNHLKSDFVQNLNRETLDEIKTLKENLNLIVNLAEQFHIE